jgi:hypothetical protein
MNTTDRVINAHGFNRQRQEARIGEDPLMFAPQDEHQQWLEESRSSRMNDTVWRLHHAWRREDVDPADWMTFEDWLDSPEGIAWLEGEAEAEAERACTSAVVWH